MILNNWGIIPYHNLGDQSGVAPEEKRFDSSRWGSGSDGHLYDFAKRFHHGGDCGGGGGDQDDDCVDDYDGDGGGGTGDQMGISVTLLNGFHHGDDDDDDGWGPVYLKSLYVLFIDEYIVQITVLIKRRMDG